MVAGIICEYNPFHNGHMYLTDRLRRDFGAQGIVCVMSGNFTQRGEAAVMQKHARAEAAVRCGADLVIELPAPFALSSAENFAKGGVALLAACGIVTHIGFGSEAGDTQILFRTADYLLSPDFDAAVVPHIRNGESYAKSRAAAARDYDPIIGEVLDTPNNNLGVEYIKAVKTLGADLVPVTVKRKGAAHDSMKTEGVFAGATFVRGLIRQDGDFSRFVPDGSDLVIRRELAAMRAPACAQRLIPPYLARLSADDFALCCDCGEGLNHRIFNAVSRGGTLSQITDKIKTKRYAYSRISRILMRAYLGITGEYEPAYLRVLACSANGRLMLRHMKKISELPIVTKPADAKKILNDKAYEMFVLECFADTQYNFMLPNPMTTGYGYTASPVIID